MAHVGDMAERASMKRVIITVLCIGATTGAVAAAAVPRHTSVTSVQPYHQESSIRVVRSSHGYRVVAQSADSGQRAASRIK